MILHHTFTNLSFTNLQIEKSAWVIHDLSFTGSEEKENISLKASRAAFTYSIDLLNREISIDLLISEPQLIIHSSSDNFLSLINEQKTPGFFLCKKKMIFDQGHLLIGHERFPFEAKIEADASLKGHFISNINENSHLKLNFLRKSATDWSIDIHCQEISCSSLHQAMAALFPLWKEIEVTDGIIQGSAKLMMQDQAKPLVYGDATLLNLSFKEPSTGLGISLNEVMFHFNDQSQGYILFFDQQKRDVKRPVEVGKIGNIAGGIFIDESHHSKIYLQGLYNHLDQFYHLSLDGEAGNGQVNTLRWNVQDSLSQVTISEGSLINSHVKGRFAEIEAELDMSKPSYQLTLSGKMDPFFQWIKNEQLRSSLSAIFEEEKFFLHANLNENQEEWMGHIQIMDVDHTEKIINFGLHWFPFTFPQPLHWMKGWFQAHELPLEKYLAPFLIEDNLIKLTGMGDVYGSLDNQLLTLTYEARQVHLENEWLHMEVAEIKQDSITQAHPVHHFDLSSGKHYGSMPLTHASYLEKNSQLLFTDIHADIVFEDRAIHVPIVETFCHGIYASGGLTVDLKGLHQGCMDIDIRPQAIHGKVTQVQNFFSHLPKTSTIFKMPLEGDVIAYHDAGHLHFAFKPNHFDMKVHLNGSLSDGFLVDHHSNIALHELSCNFAYDYPKQSLDFSDIQGTLLVGEPEKVEEYAVVGEKIHFYDLIQNRAIFDVWIGDKKRDIIRLAGETFQPSSREDLNQERVQIVLDPAVSHFGNVHPQTFHLILKDWSVIQEFRLIAELKLSSIFQDLKRLSKIGLLYFYPQHLKRLDEIRFGEGAFKVELDYNDQNAQLNYHVDGENVSIEPHRYKHVCLDGKKAGNAWIIDQLILDQFSLAADMERKSNSWLIHFLGIQLEQTLLLGLQGEYFENKGELVGKINLLEMDLEAIKKWPKVHDFLDRYPLQGHLRASGKFLYHSFASETPGKWDILLNASLKDWKFNSLAFDDVPHLTLRCYSDQGLFIGKLETRLKNQSGNHKLADLKLEGMSYDYRRDLFTLNQLDFNIPSFNLPQVLAQLEQGFPSTSSWIKKVGLAKKSGVLSGELSVDYADPHYAIKLALDDGEYQLLNEKLTLSDFLLEYDPCEMKIAAQCHSFAVPLWIQYKVSNEEELIISEEAPDQTLKNPLLVKCESLENDFIIHKVAGDLRGITFDLVREKNKEFTNSSQWLRGKISTLNAQESIACFLPELKHSISSLQMGSGYYLTGVWELQPQFDEKEMMKVHFSGLLEGKKFEFKGYKFDHLASEIEISRGDIFLKKMHVSDVSGNLQIEELNVHRLRDDKWKVVLPSCEIHDFNPRLLVKAKDFQSEMKWLSNTSIVIRNCVLENVQGILNDRNSFTANGNLEFVNPPKKNSSLPFFATPLELLNHLGLDLDASLLSPVIGTLFYEIKEGKIYLKKLKDAYSQGKMSKFYLTESPRGSYVDFDGNLRMRIKVRSDHLFFKFSDLFTIGVEGTLQKPVYKVEKQKKR